MIRFTEDFIPRQTVRFLLNGDCWRIAAAINSKTGWRLVTIRSSTRRLPFHIAVETPNRMVLDGEGIWSQSEFIKNWRFEGQSIRSSDDNVCGFSYVKNLMHTVGWDDGSSGCHAVLSTYESFLNSGWKHSSIYMLPDDEIDSVACRIIGFYENYTSTMTDVERLTDDSH